MNIDKNTVAIVTGAGSGLGEATARYLASLGAKVTLLDLNQEGVNRVAKEIDGLGLVCDVTSEASVKNALEQTKKKFGIARVCVNFAGILGGGKVVGKNGPHDLEAFKQVININLVGTFNVMRLACADMMTLDPLPKTLERGVVINTSSICAYEGQIGQVAYSASKGGVAGMTLPVAREMAEHGIRIEAIAPGTFETPMIKAASDKVREGMLAGTVFPKRFGEPEELAMFVAHIINNPMLNGDVLRIDGAMRMPPR